MCTALHWSGCFGRNLDLDQSYGEKICILPRNAPIGFRRMGRVSTHYAIIGMAVVAEGVPLYYDGGNEMGLCMAGLNFLGNAVYPPEEPGKDNVPPFELIPWVLCQCANVPQARKLLEKVNLAAIPFSTTVPLMPLHWIVSDGKESLVVESVAEGLRLYDNPAGVLTNNPPFPYHQVSLNNYRALSPSTPDNTFAPDLPLTVYSQGLGGIGLPGDLSSVSRFVRAAFYRANAPAETEEVKTVSQFFHLLSTVEMPRGGCKTDDGPWDITVYSSCIHLPSGRYYYTTYDNRQISCVDLRRTDLDGTRLLTVALEQGQHIHYHSEIPEMP